MPNTQSVLLLSESSVIYSSKLSLPSAPYILYIPTYLDEGDPKVNQIFKEITDCGVKEPC